MKLRSALILVIHALLGAALFAAAPSRNILFISSNDHAQHTISAYGSSPGKVGIQPASLRCRLLRSERLERKIVQEGSVQIRDFETEL